MEEKKELIIKLENSLDAIYQISSKQEEIQAAEDELAALDKKVKDMSTSLWDALGLILLIIALFLLFKTLLKNFLEIFHIVYWSFPIAIIIAILSLIIASCIMSPRMTRREQNAEAYRESQTVILQTDLEMKRLSMEKLVDSNETKTMQQLIPAVYTTVDAVAFFITALKNQRADSLKEAINLYETEKHNREMLDMQQQELEMLAQSIELGKAQLDAQQQILEKEKSIAWNQSMTNWRTAKISRQVRFSNAVGIINTVKHWKK
nr:hypothetical protein [uncultured Oscillibacter sp.]